MVQDEKKENELVLESISKLEENRKCWRLINGVLMEKTKLEGKSVSFIVSLNKNEFRGRCNTQFLIQEIL